MSFKKARSLAAFIDNVNAKYEGLHTAYEDQFWGTKMNLAGAQFTKDAENSAKTQMEALLGDATLLEETRRWKAEGGGSDEQNKCLDIFERTFSTYIMESKEALAMREEIMRMEGALEGKRAHLKLSYIDEAGKKVEGSSVKMRNTMKTHKTEAVRKSAYESLNGIGAFVVENGFPEIVKQRNRMAKALGFEDFYDYKVTAAEGFGKAKLFGILDTLESNTRSIMETGRKHLQAAKGESALQPWNTGYFMAGDVTAKLDPYFPFEKAVEMWGRSFSSLGIRYKGGNLNLDLLDRQGKYSNGFCHWPQCAWVKPDGSFNPSQANFTSLADPTAVGSGLTALTTLMHEAGHAAHFANITQPSPLFSQERAPTSVAYAENQSMFLDSLVGDAAWRGRYARDRAGKPVPWEILEEDIRATHPVAKLESTNFKCKQSVYKVFGLRAMLAVPYFEKALYEMPEAELTPASILKLAEETELRIQGGPAQRPLMSVPHILSDEASCYYHGYVLAEMSVHQTREYFLGKYGTIVDNAAVGAELTKEYWQPGNSQAFLDLVKGLTGKELTGDAWVGELGADVDKLVAAEKEDYAKAMAAVSASPFSASDNIDLDQHMRIVDGDAVLADTAQQGSFLGACKVFEEEVRSRIAKSSL